MSPYLLKSLTYQTLKQPCPNLGGTRYIKSPQVGGFRGLNSLSRQPEDLCVHGSLLKRGLPRFREVLVRMTRQEKLIKRLLSKPKDFTWNELTKLLSGFGFEEER